MDIVNGLSHVYQLEAQEVIEKLNTKLEDGLSETEATRRLRELGPMYKIKQYCFPCR